MSKKIPFRSRFLPAVASFAVLGLLLSGCSGDAGQASDEAAAPADSKEALIEAAKAEGKVVWYTSIPEAAVIEVAEGFTAEYGIEVEIIRFPSTTLMQRYATERDAGTVQGDVINVAETAFFEDGVANGWWADLDQAVMPSLEAWPSDLVHEGQYSLLNTQPIGVGYNTDELQAEDVDTWEEILNGDFADEFVLVNPENTPFYLSWLVMLEDEYGSEAIEKIRDFNPTVVDSAVPGAQMVAAGEDLIMAPAVISGVLGLINEGAPIASSIPTPTVGVEQYIGASVDGPHPNAGLLFIDYILSEQGQEQAGRDYAASPLPNIPNTIPLPEGYQVTDVPAVLEEKDRILEILNG